MERWHRRARLLCLSVLATALPDFGPAAAAPPSSAAAWVRSLPPAKVPTAVPTSSAETAELLAQRPGLARFLSGIGKGWTVTFDRATGEPTVLTGPGISWAPPREPGSSTPDPAERFLGAPGRARRRSEQLAQKARTFLVEYPGLVSVAPDDLIATEDGGDESHSTIEFRVSGHGTAVHPGYVAFLFNGDYLVQIHVHAARTPNVPARAPISLARAKEIAAAAVPPGGALELGDAWLEYFTSSIGSAGHYTGPLGKGYHDHLTWAVRATLRDGTGGVLVRVDAHSGAVLEVSDASRYATLQAGIFRRDMADPAVQLPLEYTDVLVGAPWSTAYHRTTNRGGVFGYTPGDTSWLQLSGPFIRLSRHELAVADCGNISFVASGSIDLGSAPWTTCNLESNRTAPTRTETNISYHLDHIRQLALKSLASFQKPAAFLGGPVDVSVREFWDDPYGAHAFDGKLFLDHYPDQQADVYFHEWGHLLDAYSKGAFVNGTLQPGDAGPRSKTEAIGMATAHLMTHDFCEDRRYPRSDRPDSLKGCEGRDYSYQTTATVVHCPVSCDANNPTSCWYDWYCEGGILTGALWDLSQALVSRYGPAEGWNTYERLFLRALTRMRNFYPGAADTAYDLLLWADGEPFDGDPTHAPFGTPNADLIFAAFDAHGIAGAARPTWASGCQAVAQGPLVKQFQVLRSASYPTGVANRIGWDAVPGALSYNLYRNLPAAGLLGFVRLAEGIAATTTSYTDTEILTGAAHGYQVTAVLPRPGGPSGTTCETRFLPVAPNVAALTAAQVIVDDLVLR